MLTNLTSVINAGFLCFLISTAHLELEMNSFRSYFSQWYLHSNPLTGVAKSPRPAVLSRFQRSKKISQTSERTFSSTSSLSSWLAPKRGHNEKNRKGRPRMRTGGSTKGTTVVWGDYGLRMRDHDRRIAAKQLQIAADAIKMRLRGQRYRLYTRVCANIGVYTKGNEVRMGKGKGSFDYWAARVAVSRVLFELKGDLHEQIVRDAFRLAGNKLPGKESALLCLANARSIFHRAL